MSPVTNEMDTVATYKSMDDIASELRRLPNTGRSVRAFAQAVLLTDTNSTKVVSRYVRLLEDKKSELPKEKGADLDDLKSQLSSYEKGIGLINTLLETVHNIFKQNDNIELDEPDTLTFLSEVQKAQQLLKHLIGYISYYLSVSLKNGEKKKMTYSELISSIKSATI